MKEESKFEIVARLEKIQKTLDELTAKVDRLEAEWCDDEDEDCWDCSPAVTDVDGHCSRLILEDWSEIDYRPVSGGDYLEITKLEEPKVVVWMADGIVYSQAFDYLEKANRVVEILEKNGHSVLAYVDQSDFVNMMPTMEGGK